MKSLFEDSCARVWHDGASPIVFARFMQIPDKKNFQQPGKITVNFVKQLLRINKNAYALIDLSDFSCQCPKVGELLYRWLFQLRTSGVAFTAIVSPKQGEMSRFKLPVCDAHHLHLFSCFEKALRNINTQMTMSLLL